MSDKKVQLLTDENLKYRFYLNQNGDAVLTSYFAKQSKEITIPQCVHDENGNTYNVVKASSAILKDHSNVEILHINALLDEVPAKLCRKFKSLKEVTVADGNTKIGSRAFYQCKKLCQANLPSTIRKIGHEAFFYCQELQMSSMPTDLSYIGTSAFFGCLKLTDDLILAGNNSDILHLGSYAFSNTFIEKVYISDFKKFEFHQGAFRSMYDLKEMYFSRISGCISLDYDLKHSCNLQKLILGNDVKFRGPSDGNSFQNLLVKSNRQDVSTECHRTGVNYQKLSQSKLKAALYNEEIDER